MVESFGALVAITLTMLLASIQGPFGDRPRSIRDSKAFASLVSLTEGRACNPTSCRISTDARCLVISACPASDRRQVFGGATPGRGALPKPRHPPPSRLLRRPARCKRRRGRGAIPAAFQSPSRYWFRHRQGRP